MLQFERAKLTARWCFNGCVAADLRTEPCYADDDGPIFKPSSLLYPRRPTSFRAHVSALMLKWNKMTLAPGKPKKGATPARIRTSSRRRASAAEQEMRRARSWSPGINSQTTFFYSSSSSKPSFVLWALLLVQSAGLWRAIVISPGHFRYLLLAGYVAM